MKASSSFKQSLVKSMLMGLQVESSSALSKNTSLLERKRDIKFSADMAMAIARGRGANWSRAVIASLSCRQDASNQALLIRSILGSDYQRMVTSGSNNVVCSKISRSKRILRRSLRVQKGMIRKNIGCPATCTAKRMVVKKTRVLKSLVPGGESLGGYKSLLVEALDYVVSLRAQVDAMRHITQTVELFSGSSRPVHRQERNGSCLHVEEVSED